MCVIIIVYKKHRQFPIIVLHGRDEDLERETAEPEEENDIICGIDGLKHGTWCGVNVASGDAVFLTNYRTFDAAPSKLSRGTLVMDHLEGKDPFRDNHTRGEFGLHNVVRFNVFNADLPVLYESSVTENTRELRPGVYALSNSTLDDLSWPKVAWLKTEAARIIDEMRNVDDANTVADRLADLLLDYTDHEYAHSGDIPESEIEELLRRRVFLHNLGRDYGTRCHSVCMQDNGVGKYFYRAINLETGSPGIWKKWTFRK